MVNVLPFTKPYMSIFLQRIFFVEENVLDVLPFTDDSRKYEIPLFGNDSKEDANDEKFLAALIVFGEDVIYLHVLGSPVGEE